MLYNQLIDTIENTHISLQKRAISSINQQLVIRNWLIGFYIVEFEQHGEDRAIYGTKLIENIAKNLKSRKVTGLAQDRLWLCRQFYTTYTHLGNIILSRVVNLPILVPVEREFQINELITPPKMSHYESINAKLSPENLLSNFSFRHFIALMRIKEPLKRAFYEKEAIKGQWEARFLERQISSLLIERVGLSTDKEALLNNLKAEIETIEDSIKDPYILEFTGFEELSKYSENDLETALLDKIQTFLQELGTGFCFEARQKRITIDGEHDRIDLVFYHRILKCHVLIDLKVRKFKHSDSGQMNFYLNYYRNEVMNDTDNPPVGIILCTEKGSATKVLYATSGLDNQIFVSKYKVELPNEEDLLRLIEQ
ncbi:YhcG family protein [Arcicella rosea]|uniref:Putative nuclease of restriction endonuclease-like (RecB) superfamily n=1 Tax=Arcicella rosea TaxID=502909 RepID=A0A841EQI5_9BACT|nr:PDDEXK nuclease domain-containing protein [Arcicella rosea]MBB6005525.1 putative nuclease of restriction endonuclease-like (RecB) superfamily [Arcicella rosea]